MDIYNVIDYAQFLFKLYDFLEYMFEVHFMPCNWTDCLLEKQDCSAVDPA